MGAAAGWVAGVLCVAMSVVVALSAIAHRESAPTPTTAWKETGDG